MSKIRYASFSETGVRTSNEDFIQISCDPDDGRYLFVCCDGMGGHAMGEVASQVVGSTICEYWEQASFDYGVESVLRTAFKLASDALDAKADVLHKVEMGTTLVLAAIDGNQLTIAYAGDSRAYLIQNGDVTYQTEDHVDHNVWGDFIDRSFFSYQREKADVEMHQFELSAGDRILLCSDGVCQFIAPDILTRRSMDDKSPEDVIDVILFLCEKFSKDNYSAILLYYG